MRNNKMGSNMQQELESLLKECREIAGDCENYFQFRQKRDGVLNQFFSGEGLN